MRKAKIFAAAGIMVISLFTGLAFNVNGVKATEGKVNVILDSVEGSVGEDVKVNVMVTSNPGSIFSETRFEYDSSILAVTAVEAKDFFKCDDTMNVSSDYVTPNLEKNPVQLIDGYTAIYADTHNTGVMYTITLKISEDARPGDATTISFYGKFYDKDMNDLEVVCEDAKVTIVEEQEEIATIPVAEEDMTTTAANQSTKTGDVAPVALFVILLASTAVLIVVAKKKVNE